MLGKKDENLGDYFISKMEEYSDKAKGRETFPVVFFSLVAHGFYSALGKTVEKEALESVMNDQFKQPDFLALKSDFQNFARNVLDDLMGKYTEEQFRDVDQIAKIEDLDTFEGVSIRHEHANLAYPKKDNQQHKYHSVEELVDIFHRNNLIW